MSEVAMSKKSNNPSLKARGSVNKKQQGSQSSSVVELTERGEYKRIIEVFANDSINIRDLEIYAENADTALHIAANRGHIETVCVLLGMLQDVNIQGHRKRTPLHCSAANGHQLVTRRLLELGAKIDAQDADNATPLHLAEKNKHEDVVLLLARKGAKTSEENMFRAISKGHKNLVEFFLQQEMSVDFRKDDDPLIVLAARHEKWEIVTLLLEKGADPTVCKDIQESAIGYAARSGNAKSVRELLERGVRSELEQVKYALMVAKNQEVVHPLYYCLPEQRQDEYGIEAFLRAAMEGRHDALKAFDELRVDVNCKDDNGRTALYHASDKGHDQCVKELLALNADFNAKDTKKYTALHAAAKSGHESCVRILLDAGAKPLEKNSSRMTPYDIAKTDQIRDMLPPTPGKKTCKMLRPPTEQ